MKNITTNYSEFISESKLQAILEAKIKFSDEFVTLISKIQSPITKKLLNLDGQEVDINRNYMTYDIEKEDSVLFYLDKKAEKEGYKITSNDHCYQGLAEKAETDKTYPINNVFKPENNQKVTLIKKLTTEELNKILPNTRDWSLVNIVHISFETQYGIRETFYDEKNLVRDISKLKPSDTKVGRFVGNFLNQAKIDFTLPELNDFIDKYKSEMKELKEKFSRFEIVTGEDIRYWYLEDRYYENSGTLGSSCMRYRKCQEYLDVYTNNSCVSLIILKSKEDSEKIIGRALLWNAELTNRPVPTDDADIKFMDRIYVSDDSDKNFFIKFAKANNFYYKREQNYSETPFMFGDEELTNEESYVRVFIEDEPNKWPYMDTIKYYEISSGILSNNSDDDHDYTLCETNGGNGSCERCSGSGEIECPNCDGSGDETCDDCYNGNNDCRDCDGDGKIECYNCEGSGDYDCSNCDGEGEVDCRDCDGTGEDGDEECSSCSGSGKESCDDCDGDGKIECSSCDGDGTTECEECGGDGDIRCETCYGEGSYECGRCQGEGTCDCPDCN